MDIPKPEVRSRTAPKWIAGEWAERDNALVELKHKLLLLAIFVAICFVIWLFIHV